MKYRTILLLLLSVLVLLTVACSAKIYGKVELVNLKMEPIEGEHPKGTVINMINTTAKVEEASHSVVVDEKGEFESEKEAIFPGTYKVEATRIGFDTETRTVEMKGSTREKIKFQLKKIPEGKRRTIEGASSDADKIINPGEVNIRPPEM
ncbi:MAG: carboxypeptidase-like regulatory domain-containing protein [Desulfobacterales bacterium]|nr:carboxypeptidase-like regulatory domain-containing protein [Desulfobacterales bacterium]MDX2508308.1 carboxypeptidase-like regulatory domain-containing protein [Desulfobacterales bacterium]